MYGPEPKKEDEDNDDDDDEDETTSTRFVARLLRFLLKGFVAKDKIVRYRCVRIVAEMVNRLGEIEYAYLPITHDLQ
jgi:condensin complex subunit 3